MEKLNKNVIPATLAVLVVFSLVVPGFVSVANAASFGSGPFDFIEGYNFSDLGSGNHWQQNSTNASIGETVIVEVFVKNTSSEVAQNVRVKLSTSASGGSGTITATISADNAGSANDSFQVNLSGSGEITSLSHTGYTKVYDAFLTQQSFSGDVVGSGVSIGNVAPGDSNSKFVLAKFEVNGGESSNGDKPEVTTRSATDIDGDEARLRGEVDPNGLDTEVWFEWGRGFYALSEDTPREDVGDGNSIEAFDFVIDGLEEDETYYFRAVARNSEGTDYGQTLSFRSGENGGENGPDILDTDVDDIDEDSAVLVCDVDPNGEDTDVWFEWAEDKDNVDRGRGEETRTVEVDGNDSRDEVRIRITGLDEDTRYFFKCLAENTDGDDESNIDDFDTNGDGGGNGPDVTTLSAVDVTTVSAVLRGDVDPNGEDTDVWFEWGTSSTNLNRDTGTEDVGDGTREVDFDARITGLSANTTYYFRAIAENRDDTDRGRVLSFRTGATTPPTIITQIIERFVEREPEPELQGLIITLDADGRNVDKSEITYTVSYDNRTDETFTDADLTVEIPGELDFVDADPREDDVNGSDVYFRIGTISPGEKGSFVIDTEIVRGVDESDEILFVANVEYTDSGTRKLVIVKDNSTLAQIRDAGAGFGAFIGGAFADFFTNPLLWLLILLLVIFFVYRYFANLARPKEAPVYIREPFEQSPGNSS